MNLYAMLASGSDASSSSALAARLAAWHDSMVAHERRLRTGRTGDACDDECPHVEARALWAEALAAFGERAHELSFLRSRATSLAPPGGHAVPPRSPGVERVDNGRMADREQKETGRDRRSRPLMNPSLRSQRVMAEAEL
jgi:hypothetical protein